MHGFFESRSFSGVRRKASGTGMDSLSGEISAGGGDGGISGLLSARHRLGAGNPGVAGTACDRVGDFASLLEKEYFVDGFPEHRRLYADGTGGLKFFKEF